MPQEIAKFTELNTAYIVKFGHPFIIAVKGLNKQEILHAFQTRLEHNPDAEFEACNQVQKIAILRLRDKFLAGAERDFVKNRRSLCK